MGKQGEILEADCKIWLRNLAYIANSRRFIV